jgi:hypothetical protein
MQHNATQETGRSLLIAMLNLVNIPEWNESSGERACAIVKSARAQGIDMAWCKRPVFDALSKGLDAFAVHLCTHGFDQELQQDPCLVWQTAATGKNPIFQSHLLAIGTPIDARDLQGKTPLMHCIMEGDRESAAFFLEHGADVNAQDEDGISRPTMAIPPCALSCCRPAPTFLC